MSARKATPVKVKLEAALRQLGLEPHDVELDHDPALALRPIDPVTGDTIPPANDPRYLIWRTKKAHAVKTTGRKGESRLCDQSSGDTPRAAKVKRITRGQDEFRARLLAKDAGEPAPEPRKRKAKIPSRPFPKRNKDSHDGR